MATDPRDSALSKRLENARPAVFAAYTILAAFTTYFCMYGFRKAFAAASYEGLNAGIFGEAVQLKTALVISQLLGYVASKFIGIKFNSEIERGRRARALIGFIILSHLALVAFAVLPPSGKVVAIFFSGLPLGMVWGLVFSYLEGRRNTEILGAGLCGSFIIASGFAKTVGTFLMNAGVPESWMPAAAGLCYFPFLLVAVWLLRRIPDPNSGDIHERVLRAPMHRRERVAFVLKFLPGLVCLFAAYVVLTVCRDFRDNFQPEIFAERGIHRDPAIFTKTETPIAFAVVFLTGLLVLVKDNRKALAANHIYAAVGALILAGSTFLFDKGVIDVVAWMILNGFGLFLAYVPFNCIFFDRMIASLGTIATSVLLIYIADALGYLGVIGVLLFENFGNVGGSKLDFFRMICYAGSGVILLTILVSWFYFRGKAVHK